MEAEIISDTSGKTRKQSQNPSNTMKFIVTSSTLLRHLQQISGVLNSSNSIPILDNFLFSIENGNLTVSASDLESTMTTEIKLQESKQNGKIAVPTRILLDTLKTFPEQPLTFLIDQKTFAIEIVSESGKFRLSGFDGEEFPKVPELESLKPVEISNDVLLSAINKTLFATGTDELRPVMSGVFFQLSRDSITFVATDAHKLVRYRRRDTSVKNEASFIVPRKPLNLLKNVLPDAEESIKLSFNENNAFFELGNYSLICRLIEGRYPNYEAVIPVENPNTLTISRQSLLNTVRRVSIFANKTTHQVRFKIAGSELLISSEDLDFANEAKERLSCSYTGEDIEIGFNAKFLSEMLGNLECEDVSLLMSAPNRAGILVPASPDNKDEDILMLVMPVMLNN